jgi:ankyrin repeat protein
MIYVFSAKSQLSSVPISFISFTLSSLKLFFSQRLGRYSDSDPPLLKSILIVAPFIVLQNFGILCCWVFIAAYLQGWILICIPVAMLSVYIFLQVFIFKCNLSTQIDSGFCDIPINILEKEGLNCFRTAILTSWVSPCSVWSNNQQSKSYYTFRKREYSSQKFLFVSSCGCIFANCICIAAIYVYLSVYNLLELELSLPITHCKESAENISMNTVTCSSDQSFLTIDFIYNSCIYKCIDMHCPTVLNICAPGKSSNDLFFVKIGPTLLSLLLISLLSSSVLQFLGNYKNLYLLSEKIPFLPCIIHHSLFKDFLASKNCSEAEIVDLIEKVSCNVINFPNPITGDTWLHTAFIKGKYNLVYQMISKGGDPFQENMKSQSLCTIFKKYEFQEIMKVFTKQRGIFFKKTENLGHNSLLTCELTIIKCEEVHGENILNGKGTISTDPTGEPVIWSLDVKEVEDVIFIMGIFEDVLSPTYLYKDTTGIFVKAEENMTYLKKLRQLIMTMNKNVNKEINCIWKDPPMHLLSRHSHFLSFYTLHIFGASIAAKNSDGLFPINISVNKPASAFQGLVLKAVLAELGPVVSSLEEKNLLLNVLVHYKKNSNRPVPELNRLMLHAAKHNHTEALDIFLESKQNFNVQDSEYETKSILHFLIENNTSSYYVEKFIEKGANVNSRDNENKTPLHIAVERKDIEMARMLIQHGSNVNNKVNKKYRYVKSPLLLAFEQKDLALFKLLLDHEADMEEKLDGRKTLLHLATELDETEIACLLITNHANLCAQDFQGKTVLHYAVDHGRKEIAQLVLETGKEGPINLHDIYGNTPLQLAIEQRNDDFVKLLLIYEPIDIAQAITYKKSRKRCVLQ